MGLAIGLAKAGAAGDAGDSVGAANGAVAGGAVCCAINGEANQTDANAVSNMRTFLNKSTPRPSIE